jgi:hypothetical protein
MPALPAGSVPRSSEVGLGYRRVQPVVHGAADRSLLQRACNTKGGRALCRPPLIRTGWGPFHTLVESGRHRRTMTTTTGKEAVRDVWFRGAPDRSARARLGRRLEDREAHGQAPAAAPEGPPRHGSAVGQGPPEGGEACPGRRSRAQRPSADGSPANRVWDASALPRPPSRRRPTGRPHLRPDPRDCGARGRRELGPAGSAWTAPTALPGSAPA